MAVPARPLVTIVPLLGPLHMRMPQYNSLSVLRSVQAFDPGALALAPLGPGALDDPGWQDCAEVALPHTVVPWARRADVRLAEVGAEIEDDSAQADFRRYLESFEGGRDVLVRLEAEERPVRELLARPLTLNAVLDALLPAVRTFQERRAEAFGEGPGTGWQAERARRTAEAVLALEAERVALLAGADDVPSLEDALANDAELVRPPTPPADDGVRRRSLLDYAMRAEAADPAALLVQLEEVGTPEARYLQANLLLQLGEADDALEVLELASTMDFAEPYYLPGFLLSRLGQLYDLGGRRAAALRAYRGVRALDYAPPEALAAAEAGMQRPFAMAGQQDREAESTEPEAP